eukprot:scaffold17639_cov30-Tisochrysis_lutea.AAC.3
MLNLATTASVDGSLMTVQPRGSDESATLKFATQLSFSSSAVIASKHALAVLMCCAGKQAPEDLPRKSWVTILVEDPAVPPTP